MDTFGRYRLLEPLGKGGMAEVFKAKSYGVEGFEKVLVIKRILPHLATNQAFVDMFVHEAKLAVRLSHANIVQVFDLGKVDPHDGEKAGPEYYIAMEYVAGLDLATLLGRARRRAVVLPVGLCLYVASEMAKGLDHAHRRRDEQMRPLGIVHRDVSPQNVLLSWEGEVKVTDFGIAKARDIMEDRADESKLGQLKGKYAYMSPEQARGKSVDARSDIFSLGTVLYELLAGVNPFGAPTPFETLRRVQAGEYPPVELLRTDVAQELAQLVRKALARNPEDRFESAGRLCEELLAYMYSSATRFGANDLAEFLSAFREADLGQLNAADVLEEPGPGSGVHESTPVEVPSSQLEARPDTGTPRGGPLSSLSIPPGERREVTALVLAFSGKLTSVPSYMRAQAKDTLARYGARLVDEEPSQMVSLFGLGESDGRDTETAVRCALVLLRRLDAGELRPSAGVHAGRVLLHASGEPSRDARLGSLVSEAQELARATAGRCAVSSAAVRHVRSLFELEPLPDQVRASLPSGGMLVGDLRTSDDAMGRFVGRKAQLRRMGEVLAAATRKHLRLVTVRGEQGIGKTRFLYEVERRLRKGDYHVGLYVASCPPRGKEVPLAGLSAMLQVLCGIREGDPPERVRVVEPRLRALGLPDEERHAVLGLLGAAHTGQAGPSVPPLRAAFARMAQSLCEDRLHALAWDNAHALDVETLDVISSAALRLSGIRGVFLLSTRSSAEHVLSGHASHEYVDIGELDEDEAAALVATRAGLRDAPHELVAFCRERAGGHPLFIEELVKDLLETHALVTKGGKVQTLRLSGEVAVPRPLRALLASRVARLEADRRAALSAAAVMGDPVDHALLAAMLAASLQQLDRIVADLEARALVRRSGPGECTFASPMLREAVLESLTPEARRDLHAAAAAAYESVLGARVEQKAGRVAVHLYEAGDRDRAASFFARSGARRLRSGQLEACVQELLRALDLADMSHRSAAELCLWLKELHTAMRSVRAAPALNDIVGRATARIDAVGELDQRVLGRIAVAAMMGAVHSFEEADRYTQQARELAGDNPALRRTVVLTAGELSVRRGEFGAALEAYGSIANTGELEREDAYRLEIGCAQSLGAAGDRERALRHLDRATELASSDDVGAAVEREKIRALILYFTRDFHASAAASERSVDLARAAGLSYEVALNLHNMGDALIWLGNFARAHVAFRQSMATCEEFGYARLLMHDRMYLTFLEADKGRDDAVETLRELIAHALVKGYTWDALNGRYLLGTLAFRQGDVELARTELERVRDLAAETHNQLLGQSASEMLAQLGATG
jgi:serine/threonine protein kinase/tetratricopeptide (TPR) repeat protein